MLKYVLFALQVVVFTSCVSRSTNETALRKPAETEEKDLLNFSLVKTEGLGGEAWKGGSRESEEKLFIDDSMAVMKAASELYKQQKTDVRVFHQKSHGCLTGKMTILNTPQALTKDLNRGIFEKPGTEYDLIARFSNGVGKPMHDAMPDVRGLALKIFLNDREGSVVDFLMTNSTNLFARDQAQFIEFMKANMAGNIPLIKFLKSQEKEDPRELDYVWHFFNSVAQLIKNPADEKYWSGHPYTFGTDSFMKFNVTPLGYTPDPENKRIAQEYKDKLGKVNYKESWSQWAKSFFGRRLYSENYLRERLQKKALNDNIVFIFKIQLYKDDLTTPIENSLIEWTEFDSTSIPIAVITLDKQHFDDKYRDAECTALRFTPGHYHPLHRPAGNMGRGRLFTYRMSQNIRKAKEEKTSRSIVDSWRRGDFSISQ